MAENRSPSITMGGHVRPERPVTFKRNQRSNSSGIRTSSSSGKEQKDETIEYRWFSLIERGEKKVALRHMPDEVGKGHLTREHEGNRSCEQPQDEQRGANEFDDSGEADQ